MHQLARRANESGTARQRTGTTGQVRWLADARALLSTGHVTSNPVTGQVSGTVIQAGDVFGGIRPARPGRPGRMRAAAPAQVRLADSAGTAGDPSRLPRPPAASRPCRSSRTRGPACAGRHRRGR
jgi:hypothetical protein